MLYVSACLTDIPARSRTAKSPAMHMCNRLNKRHLEAQFQAQLFLDVKKTNCLNIGSTRPLSNSQMENTVALSKAYLIHEVVHDKILRLMY